MGEWFSGNRQTTNFVIFGTDRTGSTLLVSLLNAHPAICCDGEILFRRRWRRPLRPLLYFWRRIPYPLLIYRSNYLRRQSRKAIYGFKLFPSHLAHPALIIQKLHQYGWLILHLQRRSLFQQSLSAAVASVTRHWHGNTKVITVSSRLSIDPAIFSASLLRVFRQRQICQQNLQSVPHLNIFYEDDLENPRQWSAAMYRICSYLGTSTSPVHTTLNKPWKQSYQKIVTNYDELLTRFKQSGLSG
jgi:LPS sulfotransferase NodH